MPPASFSCAFCYKTLAGCDVKRCGSCRKRTYCSAACQRQDWGKGGQFHKRYCGLECGEEGDLWEVRHVDDAKGYGVFALRDIARGQRIMVEKVIMKLPSVRGGGVTLAQTDHPPALMDALMALGPHGDGYALEHKVARNNMQLGPSVYPGWGGVCIRMARLNHRCDNNADHLFCPTSPPDAVSNCPCGVNVCFATAPIAAGTEICITYTGQIDTGRCSEDVAADIARDWGFRCGPDCACVATPDAFERQVTQLHRLNAKYEAAGERHAALAAAVELLACYDVAGNVSQQFYSRVCFNAFQIAILGRDTLPQGAGFLRRAHDELFSVVGHDTDATVEFKRLMADPSSNPNYLRGNT